MEADLRTARHQRGSSREYPSTTPIPPTLSRRTAPRAGQPIRESELNARFWHETDRPTGSDAWIKVKNRKLDLDQSRAEQFLITFASGN
jgi:hypothetical protein